MLTPAFVLSMSKKQPSGTGNPLGSEDQSSTKNFEHTASYIYIAKCAGTSKWWGRNLHKAGTMYACLSGICSYNHAISSTDTWSELMITTRLRAQPFRRKSTLPYAAAPP